MNGGIGNHAKLQSGYITEAPGSGPPSFCENRPGKGSAAPGPAAPETGPALTKKSRKGRFWLIAFWPNATQKINSNCMAEYIGS